MRFPSLVSFVFLTLICCSCRSEDLINANEPIKFDGSWWHATAEEERIGFLYALDDCLTFDRIPPLRFVRTWTYYEQKISEHYITSSSEWTKPVQRVFEQLGNESLSSKDDEPLDRYGSEFWRAHSSLARRGFVEGYISCRNEDSNSPKWSMSVDYYVQSLNDLYNADDRHGEDAPEYSGSVADALASMEKNGQSRSDPQVSPRTSQ